MYMLFMKFSPLIAGFIDLHKYLAPGVYIQLIFESMYLKIDAGVDIYS